MPDKVLWTSGVWKIIGLKGTVQPKIEFLSLFIHFHVMPNSFDELTQNEMFWRIFTQAFSIKCTLYIIILCILYIFLPFIFPWRTFNIHIIFPLLARFYRGNSFFRLLKWSSHYKIGYFKNFLWGTKNDSSIASLQTLLLETLLKSAFINKISSLTSSVYKVPKIYK